MPSGDKARVFIFTLREHVFISSDSNNAFTFPALLPPSR
jgi:hypothetical protein